MFSHSKHIIKKKHHLSFGAIYIAILSNRRIPVPMLNEYFWLFQILLFRKFYNSSQTGSCEYQASSSKKSYQRTLQKSNTRHQPKFNGLLFLLRNNRELFFSPTSKNSNTLFDKQYIRILCKLSYKNKFTSNILFLNNFPIFCCIAKHR